MTVKAGISQIVLACGWDVPKIQSSAKFDLDLIAFTCDVSGKGINACYFG